MSEAEIPAVPAIDESDTPSTIYDDNALAKVNPKYRTKMRISAAIFALIVIGAALAVEFAMMTEEVEAVGTGTVAVPVILVMLLMVYRLPRRRYDALGFAMSDDRLRVARGIWFRSDTVVPFGRVQHLDVQRGPLERVLGLATLVLHTAGNHNASVSLPGLEEDQAITLREEIREHIKTQTL